MKNNHYPFCGCGIAGLISYNSNTISDTLANGFRKMLDCLKHRGPDGEGIFTDGGIILGHRRLSIIDLSNKGSQPMTRDHFTITLNGEIYNYNEIKKELEQKGYSFTSETDTEVVLRSFQCWGKAAL
jgi:asparagine synthase (glutamine-hydrolysing)